MDEERLDTLRRLIDGNGWEWRTVVKVMNRRFNAQYSIDELKEIYQSLSAQPECQNTSCTSSI